MPIRFTVCFGLLALSVAVALAEPQTQSSYAVHLAPTEGMWLFNALPTQRLKTEFHFDASAAWAAHLQLSSVKIGASGAFVSPDGLVLTNHHVAAGAIQNVSRAGGDLVSNGFVARTRADEIPLPGTELSVLEQIQDVTDRINRSVDPKLPAAQAVKALHAAFAKIELESLQKTGLQSSVVTLYGGALYHLYRYKRYTDVRLVFAPEESAAFFGGDPDNFEYPRYDLDITFLRAYENGRPARVKDYLKISTRGVTEGDLVFVSGNPGRTDRLLPVSALKSMRDVTVPLSLEGLERQEKTLLAYASAGPEQYRQAQRDIFSVENSLKATRARMAALQGGLIGHKAHDEEALRHDLRAHPQVAGLDAAWEQMAQADDRLRSLWIGLFFMEDERAFATPLFRYARQLVRLSTERARPDEQRLPEYTQANLTPLEHRLLARRPIYPELEIAKLTESLSFFRDRTGADSPLVKKMLAGKSPEARARELVKGTRLQDAAERRRLYEGGAAAIDSSDDSMIALAREIDGDARDVRLAYEAQVQEPQRQALAQINRARFALFGQNVYPDATGTLRLAFGVVQGYEQDGQKIAPWTTMAGAFGHETAHGATPPYRLPQSWHRARERLALDTPLNFVCTADITGGNSGSPVVNRDGQLVGLIFDSNRQGIADNFDYTDVQARAVCVDVRAILEALDHIYGADSLVTELRQNRQ